jgi:hypothetical protein
MNNSSFSNPQHVVLIVFFFSARHVLRIDIYFSSSALRIIESCAWRAGGAERRAPPRGGRWHESADG